MGTILALDIGERRIGVARANMVARLPEPLKTITNTPEVGKQLEQLIKDHKAQKVIVGLPRNLEGSDTAQTKYVQDFVRSLSLRVPVEFQDEALTSVHATQRLDSKRKVYQKSDIDAEAACIILQDYLEAMN